MAEVLCIFIAASTGVTASTAATQAGVASFPTEPGLGAVHVDPLPPGAGVSSGGPSYLGPAGTPSPWEPLANQPPFSPDGMLLLTDGSVLVHQYATGNWWRLAPSATGSYVDGTWSQVASMPSGYAPLYFASAVLPSGQVIVEGGEYNFVDGTFQLDWTNLGAIYDPVTNMWAAVSPPNGWSNIGDAPSAVLADGRFMLGSCCGSEQAILNAGSLTWTSTGAGKADGSGEEGWTLLPGGQLLTVDTADAPNTELYTPSSGTWASAGPTPDTLIQGFELGPQVLSPDGWVFVVGATGATALYNTSDGVWSAGPTLPVIGGTQYSVADGPGSILPNGDVLIDASAGGNTPTHFFVFDGMSLTQVADAPGASSDVTYYTRMLVLPTGQVMFTGGGNEVSVYTGTGSPKARWRPRITSAPKRLAAGSTNTLSGVRLDGLTQGAAYGDDFQDATNYPLVRITNTSTQTVAYARTTDMTSRSVARRATSSVNFTLPANIEAGPSSMVVVANGIASKRVSVSVTP